MDKVLSREDFVLELFVVSRRISIIAQKVEAIDKLKDSHEALRERVEELERLSRGVLYSRGLTEQMQSEGALDAYLVTLEADHE